MNKPRRFEAASIEVLEPLVLMSAAAIDVEFDVLDDATAEGDLLLATEAGGRVDGGQGDDRLIAAAGANALDGGPGNDLLYSLRGDNVLTGGAGDDTAVYLDGGVGDYTVRDLGFGGIVEVTAGPRADLLYDVERISFRDGTFTVAQLINGEQGEPMGLRAQSSAADLDEGQLQNGTAGADVLAALRAGDLLDGTGGNDLLVAVAGDNDLQGGAGDDDFLTARGRNFIDGGAGLDRVSYQVAREDVFLTDRGDGTVLVEADDFTDSVRDVELFEFGGVIVDVTDLEFDAAMLLPVSVEPPVDVPEIADSELPEFADPDPAVQVTVSIPVEPDGGIGDGAPPLPELLPLPFPIDENGNPVPIPVEPDGGIGDGAPPLPELLPLPFPIDENGNPVSIPVEPDGGIGDGATPLPELLPLPFPIDENGNPVSIPVEPDGGIGDGETPVPIALPLVNDPRPNPVESDGGMDDGGAPIVVTSDAVGITSESFPTSFPIEVTPTFVPTIEGTDAAEWISGTTGDDVIVAGGGDDEIHVPVGDNQVDGGDGVDTLVIYEGSRAQYLFAVRSDGVTTISGPGLNGETVTVDLLNVEQILFNDGLVDLTGATTVMPQQPGTEGMEIYGTDAGEWIGGTHADDRISAGGGDDEIYAAVGENTVDGGEGTDTLLVYGNRSDYSLLNLGDGRIYLEGPGLNGETVRNTLTSVEQIRFSDETVLTADIPDLPITIQPYPLPGDQVTASALPAGTSPAAADPSAEGEESSLLVAASEPAVLPTEHDADVNTTSGFRSMPADDFGMASLSAFLPDMRTDLVAMANAARELLETMDADMTPGQLLALFGEQLGIDLTQDELRTSLNSMLRQVGFDLDVMLATDGFGGMSAQSSAV